MRIREQTFSVQPNRNYVVVPLGMFFVINPRTLLVCLCVCVCVCVCYVANNITSVLNSILRPGFV